MAEEKETTENNETETEKKSFLEWCEEHPKTVFVIRIILWALCAAILPVAFIAWRYDIFTPTTKISMSGWLLVAIVIVVVFFISLIRYIYKGLKPGLFKQCVFGLVSIILPLIVFYLIINVAEDNISLFKQALGCVIICEAVGIPLNPFPDWIAKRQVENETQKAEKMSDIMWDKFFKRKKDEEK